MCLVLPCRNASSCCFLRCKCNEGSLTQSVSQSTTTEEEGDRGNPQLILAVWEWKKRARRCVNSRSSDDELPNPLDSSCWIGLNESGCGWWTDSRETPNHRAANMKCITSRKWHKRKSFIGGRGGPAEDEASSWEIRVSCSFYSRTTRVLIQIYSSSNRERDDRLRHGRWSAPFNWHQPLEFCRPPL